MTAPEKKSPHITIRLKPRQDFSDGSFCPLSLPTGLDALFLDPRKAAGAVERICAHLTCRLAPGDYAFGLHREEPLVVRVPEELGAELHFACARVEGARTPVITSLEILFNRPLQLDHVLPTLFVLPKLFDDRDWSAFRDAARQMGLGEIRSAFSRFADNLGRHVREGVDELGDAALQERLRGAARTLGGLVDSLSDGLRKDGAAGREPNLPNVYLTRVLGIPRTRADRREVDFAFSGELGWPGRVLRRFEDVVLPKTLIPSLHGELADLLTAEPLSSAYLHLEQIDGLSMARSAARMITAVEGAWKVEITRPTALFEARLHDHARVQVEAALGDLTISGSLRGEQDADRFTASATDVELEQVGHRLFGDMHLELESREPGLFPCEAGLLRLLGEETGEDGVDARLRVSLRPESTLGKLDLMVRYFHPHVRGGTEFPLRLDEGLASLDLELSSGGAGSPWVLSSLTASTRATFEVTDAASVNDGRTRVEPETLRGTLSASAGVRPDGGLHARVEGDCAFAFGARVEVEPLPELGLEEGVIRAHAAGTARFDLHTAVSDTDPVRVDFDGSRLDARLTALELTSSGTSFVFPAGLDLAVDVDRMSLDATGTGRTQAAVSWSMNGFSPVLARAADRVEVLVPELWSGRVKLEVDPLGHLEVTGHRGGLYDAHFWNALVNPGAEPARWVEIFLDEAAMDKVVRALGVFHDDAARALERMRRLALRARDILDEMGVRRPGDFLPAHRIAAFAARLADDPDAPEAEWHEVVLQAVTGGGLDVPRVRRLLDRVLPEHHFHFELDRMLRIASMLLAPTEPVPPATERTAVPLALSPEHAFVRELPSAAGLVAVAAEGARAAPSDLAVLAGVSHYLTLEQLRHLLAAPELPWRPVDLARVRLVCRLKERVTAFSEHFGGVGYLFQPWALSFFLGEAATADLPHHRPPLRFMQAAEVGPWRLDPELILQGVLGPHDLAVLIQCGLAAPAASRTVQVDQHLLYSLLARAPRAAVRQVLCVLGQNSERLLSHALYGLLNSPRDLLRRPVDVAALIEEATGVPMPRQADHLAQGRRARDSYYEALSRAAAAILDRLDPERALFSHLREHRHPAPEVLPALDAPSAVAAQKAIAHADHLAAACTFSPREKTRRQKAVDAHEAAVVACRAVLAAEPRALAEPWLKAYLARHFEALQVLSVVRNHQEDVDRVRPWLTRRCGRDVFDGEQDLLRAVIDVLYHDAADREAVWTDPLVRLLWDAPDGRLDFSLVSCMGVITEGSRGTELDETFARLLERRGVATVRADTATARSLEYNADRAIEAIEGLRTPYGLVGYSQGCANALCAEARLLAGPPRQQALARGLRGRMFLFSAINGSAHGTCGDWKFYRAMVELDRLMKHYQGVFSGPAIAFVLQNLGALLDSRAFVQGFGGMASLSYEGVVALAREGQFRDGVPTCMLRGIVEPETLPEALELLASALTAQLPDPRHDTQVQVEEAVGHFTYVRNPWADVLRRCDLGARVQATHHWSPLLKETAFLTTDRDRDLCIYDVPKDRHIFPWVDLLHRFGFIGEKKV